MSTSIGAFDFSHIEMLIKNMPSAQEDSEELKTTMDIFKKALCIAHYDGYMKGVGESSELHTCEIEQIKSQSKANEIELEEFYKCQLGELHLRCTDLSYLS